MAEVGEQFGEWIVLEPIGQGGQGKVYKARKGPDPRDAVLAKFRGRIETLTSIASQGPDKWAELRAARDELLKPEELRSLAEDYRLAESAIPLGALKILHEPSSGEALEKPLARLRKEVEVLKSINHPNLVRLLDQNVEEHWFVTELFTRGTLAAHQGRYRGEILETLQAFRPLVEGVAQLHSKGVVHRDIKPGNIFIGDQQQLVLGDTGIVHFEDAGRTRVSESYENVGSRDWMPAWAMGLRLDDVRPTFDVFTLGKVFWSMLSGREFLQLWYHDNDAFNVEVMFPHRSEVKFARWILTRTVVQWEKDCLPNAQELLELVDQCINVVSRGASFSQELACQICGVGKLVQLSSELTPERVSRYGVTRPHSGAFRLYRCNKCGHVDLFHFDKPENVPEWWSGGPPSPDKEKP